MSATAPSTARRWTPARRVGQRHPLVAPGHAPGYDGVVNDYFPVRTGTFVPRGTLSDTQLAAENVQAVRWWSWRAIAAYRGDDLFSPRELAAPLTALVTGGVPTRPVRLGR